MSDEALLYRCPEVSCNHAPLVSQDGGLSCPHGHFYPFEPGTSIPVFTRQSHGTNEYTSEESPAKHDNALQWVLKTFGTDEPSLRRALVERLDLCPGDRVIVTGAGTGNDLPYLAERLAGRGHIVVQDIAVEMLLEGYRRHADAIVKTGVNVAFFIGDATTLPLADGAFDAAFHFGGINLFPDVRRGVSEMNRIVKDGGKVVFGDEGLAPWLRDTELGKMLVNNNSLYACDVPLAALPPTARMPRVSWELCNTFYVVEFVASREPLPVDIDVKHLGTRGGSIRTRYSGRLEGIDPELRERVYREAERRRVSRVEFLESALSQAVGQSGGDSSK